MLPESLRRWAPQVHRYIQSGVLRLEKWDRLLCRPFLNSVFPALTVNFGPRTICNFHRDYGNLAGAFCGITALGKYDFTLGGHLVLWEYQLIIEFPPGYTILIPSALVTHGNLPIGKKEVRYSFTQYAAGGLFRWVENGYQSNKSLFAQMEEKEIEAWKAAPSPWREGIQRFRQWNM